MKKIIIITTGLIILMNIGFVLGDTCTDIFGPGAICDGGTTMVTSGGIQCSSSGTQWINLSDSSIIGIGESVCYYDDAVEDKECCPLNSYCNKTGGTSSTGVFPGGNAYIGTCIPILNEGCATFDGDENNCKTAGNNILKYEVEHTFGLVEGIASNPGQYSSYDRTIISNLSVSLLGCINYTQWQCSWLSGNRCGIENDRKINGRCPDNATVGVCQRYSAYDDQCENLGIIKIGLTVVKRTGEYAIGGELENECTAMDTIIPCEDITRLDFFNWINVTAVIVILVIVYYFYATRKGNERKIKGKKRK
jgi:hypothetical protein